MQFWIIQGLNSLSLGGLLFLLSSGFSLIFGLMRVANLTHGAFFMLGTYLGAIVLRDYSGLNIWVAALGAGIVVAALGGGQERVRAIVVPHEDGEETFGEREIGPRYLIVGSLLGNPSLL